ncbi:MAG: hypothetical protein GX275_06545 [Clostridiales bacterium]|nr:hypothetical protein [Clostridiales bacterium]
MERISSMFFLISLLIYFIPKLFKVKKSKYINLHIGAGIISLIAMILALVKRIGQYDFIKYCGFTAIILFIAITGFLIKKNPRIYRILHIILTILFFVYLFITITFFK